MNRLVFFAASKDQLAYFSKLQACLPKQLSVWWYKKFSFPAVCFDLPFADFKNQIDFLQKRKQNTASGQMKFNFYWSAFRALKWLESSWLFLRYLAFLKSEPAEYIGVWNGKKFRQAILVLAAKKANKKIIYFEKGPLPEYSCLDPKGVDFCSSLPKNIDFYKQYNCKAQNVMPLRVNEVSLAGLLPKNYIFVPFQVVEDSNIYLHSPWLPNMRTFYVEIESLSQQNPALSFIIKEHPACPEKYNDLKQKALQTNGRIQFVEDIDSISLVLNALAVITINSTVGMEAIMARKKLIVLGKAIYGFDGLVKLATNRKQLSEVFSDFVDWEVDEDLVNHYLCFIKNEYAITGDAMYSLTQEHLQKMTEKLQLVLSGKEKQAIGLGN
jgi:capsular polysaccharide export protein